jgi:hypothetical protein
VSGSEVDPTSLRTAGYTEYEGRDLWPTLRNSLVVRSINPVKDPPLLVTNARLHT